MWRLCLHGTVCGLNKHMNHYLKTSFTNKPIYITVARLFMCVSFILSASLASAANIPTPRIKPEAPNISASLSKRDASNFRQGMRAADNRQWESVEKFYRRIEDPTAKRILLWRQAADDPYVSFSTLTDVVQNQSDWPRMTRIRAKAETHLFDRPLSPDETITWFLGAEPVSGEGRGALAHAYYKRGQDDIGDQWLRSAWRDSRLTRDRQKKLFSRYKSRLTADDHATRADHLVWQGRRLYPSAEGLLSLMDRPDRALLDARMRVGANRTGMDKAIKAVPSSHTDDAGLLYERARWRRRKRTETYALPVYLEIQTPPHSEKGKVRVWKDKKYMVYWALKNKKYSDAYKLTLHHGLTKGEHFADAEFLAGWISLTKLNKPEQALTHFTTLKGGVTLPVSSGRASYWQGRAADEMGDASATTYFAEAAKYPNVFYSQLASEKLAQGYAYISLPPEDDGSAVADTFEGRELTRALRMIGEVQSERTFNQFSFHMDDELDDVREITLLSGLAKQYGYMKPSVRAAKQAGRLDAMLTESGYPMPEIITNLDSKFDIPFVLAIARQESEFNTRARSHAKAYGMMQMINATAKSTARNSGVRYNKSWLIGDPEYAAKLGAYHLNELLDKYDGSYMLAAAAYNAGPRRVNIWIKDYGDPRTNGVDPIDWLETIPYSETRNYIHRVMENLEVYRARLNGNNTQLQLMHDLTAGAFR